MQKKGDTLYREKESMQASRNLKDEEINDRV